MKIDVRQTAAVIVDYQERLMPVMYEKEMLLKNSEILIEGLKLLKVPMMLTQQYTKGLGNTVSAITTALGSDEYIEKLAFSSYEAVKGRIAPAKYIVVCGIEAHICVLQTVLDLKAEGFVPVLVADCISSRSAHNKAVALERARQEGAIITTYESLLFELMGTAADEQFKGIQRLITK